MKELSATGVLNQPLVFGNIHQIRARKELEAIFNPPEGMNRYEVTIEISGDDTMTVDAKDEDEAKELAREGFDIDSVRGVTYSVKKIE